MSQTFIVAYDGSPASRAAVQLAVDLAPAQDAEVVAVHVYPFVAPVAVAFWSMSRISYRRAPRAPG